MFNKIYPKQYGFRPSNSCMNQFLTSTLEIFEAFDCNLRLEVRSVFLDISKELTNDKFCHEALLYKLRSRGISEELLDSQGLF